MQQQRTDHMAYLPNMEQIGEEVLEEVLKETRAIDFSVFTEDDVATALSKENLSNRDFAALLSPAAQPHLE